MQGEQAVVHCDSTKGPFSMRFYRDWSPYGYDRAVELYETNFFDDSHFFRAVPDFLVQFGITYSHDKEVRRLMDDEIPDDPQLDPPIKFDVGVMSYAGSGPNSRTSQMFINYNADNAALGENPWETPFGIVEHGMDNVKQFYSYGDMPPWGKGPEQNKIYSGPHYINDNFPLIDKMKSCRVQRLQPGQDGHAVDYSMREALREAKSKGDAILESDYDDDGAGEDVQEENYDDDGQGEHHDDGVGSDSGEEGGEEDDEYSQEEEDDDRVKPEEEVEEVHHQEEEVVASEHHHHHHHHDAKDTATARSLKGIGEHNHHHHRHLKIGRHEIPLSPMTGAIALGCVVAATFGILRLITPKRKQRKTN